MWGAMLAAWRLNDAGRRVRLPVRLPCNFQMSSACGSFFDILPSACVLETVGYVRIYGDNIKMALVELNATAYRYCVQTYRTHIYRPRNNK